MAKKSMVARKNKRVRLQKKYLQKRMAIKEAIKKCDTFEEAIELDTKLQNFQLTLHGVDWCVVVSNVVVQKVFIVNLIYAEFA